MKFALAVYLSRCDCFVFFASVAGFPGQHRGRGGVREGRGRGGGGGGRGRGRGRPRGGGSRGKKKHVEKSADEPDKELDNYHAEAMQTS